MIKKIFCSIAVLAMLSSCAKDSGTPDPDFGKNIQEQLGAYVWHPIPAEIKEENELVNYKLLDCELDNSYRFLFQENSNQLKLDVGNKICEANLARFEQIVFRNKNSLNFTFINDKGVIKFEDQDQYSSYLAAVKGDQLVLTYQNNNPAALIIPMKYYFKGVKK